MQTKSLDTGLADTTRIVYTSGHGDNLGARGVWGESTMYEGSAGCPLIVAGEGLPQGKVVTEPVSHVDIFPFILDAAGEAASKIATDRPGVSLKRLAKGEVPQRNALVEYHAIGSSAGAFCIRQCNDPEELRNLAGEPEYAAELAECDRALRAICDPVAVERPAKARQGKQKSSRATADARRSSSAATSAARRRRVRGRVSAEHDKTASRIQAMQAILQFALAAVTLALGGGAFAQAPTYSSKPIRMIVPYAGGGGLYVLTRNVAQDMLELLGQSIAIENKMGAGGAKALAVTQAKRSPLAPDIPTVEEVTGIKCLEVFPTFCGLLAPAGSPPQAVEALQKAAATLLARPETKAKLAALGTDVFGFPRRTVRGPDEGRTQAL